MRHSFSIACAALLLMSGSAFAQTCSTPPPYNLNAGEGLSGDTCTGANIAGTLCGAITTNEKDIFYQVTLASGYTATSIDLTNSTAGYTPLLVLYTGACANGGPTSGCSTAGFGAPGGNASMSLSSSPTQGNAPVPAGTYFMDVTAPTGGACGQYTLGIIGGTLPVKLQKFSVQ